MIQFENVSFGYEKKHLILKNVNFSIQNRESVGLIGANGAGKSTLMKLILGLLQGEGTIRIDTLPVEKKNYNSIRKKIGYVLQDSDNQMFMPTVYEDMIFGPRNYGCSKEETDQKVNAVLEKLHLTHLKHCYNHKLSGGEKRMAAIATILTVNPDIILMDEPSIALDPANRRLIIKTIQSLSQTRLIASHDLDMILDTCDRVILLSHGEIVADGKVTDILYDKSLLENNHLELPLRLQR